jgi:hypothetical protein
LKCYRYRHNSTLRNGEGATAASSGLELGGKAGLGSSRSPVHFGRGDESELTGLLSVTGWSI